MIDFYEHIGAYITGKLEGELLASFEAELGKDAELRAAVDNHDVVEELLDLMYEDELRGVLNEESGDVIQKIEPIKKVKKLPYLRWMSVAAGIAAIIAVGFLFKDQLSIPSNEDLFAKHMSPYMGTTVRGNEIDDDTIAACDQGHYFLDQGDVDKARALFIDDLKNDATNCNDKSEWYLCLIYLKSGDELNRDRILNKIIQSGKTTNSYYDKALKLQADLK